jgi:hypothetical protein
MGLDFLVRLLVRMGVTNKTNLFGLATSFRTSVCGSGEVKEEEAYPLNGPVTAKLALEVLFVGFITEPGNDESFEGIATDVWIIVRVNC